LQLVESFVDRLEDSIQERSFQTLTLRGVKATKRNGDASSSSSSLRGSIRQVQGRLVRLQSREDELLLQVTLKYHLATDIVKNVPLSDLRQTVTSLMTDPSVASEWGVEAARCHPMRGALLDTAHETWELTLDKKPKLQRLHVRLGQNQAAAAAAANHVLSHDRVKQVPVSIQAEFLQRLGVTKPDGTPRPGMKSKVRVRVTIKYHSMTCITHIFLSWQLRQCQKFVEIVGNLVDTAAATPHAGTSAIRTMDLGCGRGYLTFALHSYLSDRYDTLDVSTVGIDVRPKLVQEISTIARSLGEPFQTLRFEVGTIDRIVATANDHGVNDDDTSLDILVALHACDTATDDAIYSGVARKADVIVVAPCCQKELRPQIDAGATADHPILRHAIYRERLTEIATDSLRSLLLEMAGYKVKTFEFIGGEHTAKNVMITAVRDSRSKRKDIREQIRSLAKEYGLQSQKLAQWMGVDLMHGEDLGHRAESIGPKIHGHRMPPSTLG
jgi:SAM-dependent methyltransferase